MIRNIWGSIPERWCSKWKAHLGKSVLVNSWVSRATWVRWPTNIKFGCRHILWICRTGNSECTCSKFCTLQLPTCMWSTTGNQCMIAAWPNNCGDTFVKRQTSIDDNTQHPPSYLQPPDDAQRWRILMSILWYTADSHCWWLHPPHQTPGKGDRRKCSAVGGGIWLTPKFWCGTPMMSSQVLCGATVVLI